MKFEIRKMKDLEMANAAFFGTHSVNVPPEAAKQWGGPYGYEVKDKNDKLICYAGNGVNNDRTMKLAIRRKCLFILS